MRKLKFFKGIRIRYIGYNLDFNIFTERFKIKSILHLVIFIVHDKEKRMYLGALLNVNIIQIVRE